jgi:predicted TIM-barrel fold metal-dependent hydrolase
MQLDYRLIDADNHYYEPRDAFTRFMEPRYRDLAVKVERSDDGADHIFVGQMPYNFNFTAADAFDRVGRPGSLRQRMRLIKSGETLVDRDQLEMDIPPEFTNRSARLQVLDEQGIEAAIMLPSLGVGVEHFMMDNPDQLYANLRAFNRWLDEDWGLNFQNRIFSPPLLSLIDLPMAIAELEWSLGRGARVIHLRPAPIMGRSIADPAFDQFWARVEEAGVLVAFHISNSGYNELISPAWGEPANPPVQRMSAWQWTCSYGDRPIMDTMAALVLHNLFGRFPGIRVASIENGSLWVDYLLSAMDKYRGMGRHGNWIGGPVLDRPSRIFKEHVYVSPFHEENVVALTELIGVERVLFGSDFPHAEGLAAPSDFAERLAGLNPTEVRSVMRENAGHLLGLSPAS